MMYRIGDTVLVTGGGEEAEGVLVRGRCVETDQATREHGTQICPDNVYYINCDGDTFEVLGWNCSIELIEQGAPKGWDKVEA